MKTWHDGKWFGQWLRLFPTLDYNVLKKFGVTLFVNDVREWHAANGGRDGFLWSLGLAD